MNNYIIIGTISLLILAQDALSQGFKGHVIDKHNNPIEFATVLNRSNKKFTYTNNKGYFNLDLEIGDSIEIQHVSYLSGIFIIEEINQREAYTLNEKEIQLKEVVVTPSTKNVERLKSPFKKKTQYGLAVNSDYLFNLSNEIDSDFVLEELIIPIHFRKNYSSEGSLLIQILRLNKNSSDSLIPIQKVKDIPITQILDEKEISLSFEGLKVDKNDKIYIFMKRVISERIYSLDSTNLSVNPFIYICSDTSGSSKSYVKRIGEIKNWINLSAWFGYEPSMYSIVKFRADE